MSSYAEGRIFLNVSGLLGWLWNTKARKRALVGVGVAVVTMAILAALGFWSPDSARYWRRPAQAALFFVGRHAPHSASAALTRWALRAHTTGVTYAEAEEAATLFQHAGEGRAASALRLGLVRLDAASRRYDQAVTQATLSQKASPNQGALVALVILHEGSGEERAGWVNALQAAYPEQELSQVFWCVSQLQSLSDALPPQCEAVDWLQQRAHLGRDEYSRISKQIDELPKQATLKIKENNASIAELTKEVNKYQSQYQSYSAELARLESEGVWDATGKAIINFLPLPKPGDTFGSYVAREGICALPVIRVLCRADVLEPYIELRRRRQQLNELRDLNAELVRLTRSQIETRRTDIRYWQSKAPLEKLVKERDALLPAFQAEVEKNISGRRPDAGLALDEAIAVATRQ